MRWNTRSAPERSTRHATPEYFASNARAIFSATGRSTDVYQATLPSCLAAAINSGVTLEGSTAAVALDETAPNASAADALSRFLLDRPNAGMGSSLKSVSLRCSAPKPGANECTALPGQHPASLCRHVNEHGRAGWNVFLRRRRHPQLG